MENDNSNLMNQNILDKYFSTQKDEKMIHSGLAYYQTIIKKYSYLELAVRWGCPSLIFCDKIIVFFVVKTELEKIKFSKPQLFIGFVSGYKVFTNSLFEDTAHTHVRYININRFSKTKANKILDILGQLIEL